MITIRITRNPLGSKESAIHLLRELLDVVRTGKRSSTVEFQLAAPGSTEVSSFRFRFTYIDSKHAPKGTQR